MSRNLVAGTLDKLLYSGVPGVVGPPFTLALRIRATTLAQSTCIALCSSTTKDGFFIEPWDNTHIYAVAQNASGTQAFTDLTNYTATATWYSVVYVAAGASSRNIYVNASTNSNSSALTVSGAALDRLTIGYRIESGTALEYFNGDIADAAVWSTDFTAADANAFIMGFVPPLIRPDALVHYWPLIGRGSTEIDLRGLAPLTPTNTSASDHPPIIQRRKRQRLYFPASIVSASPQIAVPISDVATGGWLASSP